MMTALCGGRRLAGPGLQPEDIGQSQTADAERPELEELAAELPSHSDCC